MLTVNYKKIILKLFNISAIILMIGGQLHASEGAESHYIVGTYGDFRVAMVADDGLSLRDDVIFADGSVQRTIMQNRLNSNLELDYFLNMLNVTYHSDYYLFGGRYSGGIRLPFVITEIITNASIDNINYLRHNFEDSGFKDIYLIPVMLNWERNENLFISFYQGIVVPSGSYNVDRIYNLGRNYWSFDTNGAITWFCPRYNFEASATAGMMFNTTNNDTDYHTGMEFHFDYAIGVYLAEYYTLGLTGYFYDQVTGDSKSGAKFGKTEGYAVGLGPILQYSAATKDALPLMFSFKILYDVDTEVRYKGKSYVFSFATQFL